MPLDEPIYASEQEINLQAATLTSNACASPLLAIDDDPATAAVFGPPPGPNVTIPYVSGPNLGGYWDTIAQLAAANAGQHLTLAHLGGPIGVFLADYGGFFNNQHGSPDPFYTLSMEATPGLVLGTVTPDIFSATPALFGSGQVYPPGVYRVTYGGGGMELQPPSSGISGWTAALYTVAFNPSAQRFLRVDWGFDAFISRIRLAYSGPGAGSVGVDYESSLSYAEGQSPPADIALSYLPSPVDGHVHEVVFSPPVLGRGAVFLPDALLPPAQSGNSQSGNPYQAVNLYQLQVYQDVSQGVPLMPKPSVTQVRVGCSGAVITPRAANVATTYPFSQALASVLQSIQGVKFSSASKLARETGGDTVHQLNGYETDREIKAQFSIERYDYQALQNILAGTLVVNPANGPLPETQYHAPNYTDRVPYFSLVALSTNGDPAANFVMPKCKIDGNLTHDLERDKATTFDVDFVLFWDFNYTRQDGTLGGIYEMVFNNGGAVALHS